MAHCIGHGGRIFVILFRSDNTGCVFIDIIGKVEIDKLISVSMGIFGFNFTDV